MLSRLGLRLRPASLTAMAPAARLLRSQPSRLRVVSGALNARWFQTGNSRVLQSFTNPKPDPETGRILALNALRPAPGSRKKTIRLGRGEGTHFGKSAGRGMRGTYHRRALRKRNFEGGQTPLHRRLPKRGHHVQPFFQERFCDVSLSDLQYLAETGRLDATKPIQIKHLYKCGYNPRKDGLRIVGAGAHRLMFPLHVEASRCDDLAKFAIEQAGGSVKLVYHSRLGMRAHLHPEKFAILPSAASVPPPKKRHHYVPYDMDGVIPPLLFKSRVTAGSPLAKFWTPSPVATTYLAAVAARDAARAKLKGAAPAAAKPAAAAAKQKA